MGVDYSAEFGIGYKVEATDDLLDWVDFQEFIECLDSECKAEFRVLESGNHFYGKNYNAFMVLSSPFKDGLDLTKQKELLDKELSRLKVKPTSNFGAVGGLLVW